MKRKRTKKEKRENRIEFVVSDFEHEKIISNADTLGLSVAAYIRGCVLYRGR